MAEFVPLTHLMNHGRDAGHPVAWDGDHCVSMDAFAAQVSGWRAAFAARPGLRWGLYFDDSLRFAAALLGAWHAGKCVFLPADARPATLARLAAEVEGFAGDLPASCDPLTAESAAPGDWRPLAPDARQLVVYTSGSTGTPVAIPKQLGQLFREVESLASCWDPLLGAARVLATVSHQHIYGLLFRVLWPLAAGRPFTAAALSYPEDIVAALAAGPAALVASPAHLKRLPPLDWTSVRHHLRAVFSSGGPLPESALDDCRQLLGQAPLEVYGSSECGGIAYRQRSGDATAWRPLPGVEIRVQDERLWVRSPHLPDAGWLETADRVRLSADGFELIGRGDRIVKVEEKRVSLTALEDALTADPLLCEARVLVLAGSPRSSLAVVAVPSAAGWALAEESGKRALNEALRRRLADLVEPTALPRFWRYVRALPVNAQGKITEAALTALFEPGRPPCRLLAQDAASATLEVEAAASLPYFDGHFPGSPILPGVAQVEWALRFARELFPLPGEFRALEALKFQQVIAPGTVLTLELTLKSERLEFRWSSAAGLHASGRVLFEAAA